MRRLVLALFLSLAVTASCSTLSGDPQAAQGLTASASHHGVFIEGQSNAVGRGDCSPVGLCSAYPAVQMQQKISDAQTDPITWELYPPQDLDSQAGGQMGIELALGRALDAADPTNWAVAKYAVSGTGLQLHWLPTANYPTKPTGVDNLYTQGVAFDLDAAANLDASIDVVVWIQGERDAKNATQAANYEENLTTLVDNLRADLGSDFLFVFTELRADNAVYTYRSTVRAEQESYASHCTHCVLINTDDLSLQGDHTHYNSPALVTLGNRVADAILVEFGP